MTSTNEYPTYIHTARFVYHLDTMANLTMQVAKDVVAQSFLARVATALVDVVLSRTREE